MSIKNNKGPIYRSCGSYTTSNYYIIIWLAVIGYYAMQMFDKKNQSKLLI